MDITKAEFWNTPDTAGLPTISYAELLAQITASLSGSGVLANPNLLKGCHATAGSTSITGGGRKIVPLDTEIFDDLGFLDLGGANPERMTIPDVDPPITRIIMGGAQTWGASTNGNERTLVFVHNFNEIDGGSQMSLQPNPVPGPANRYVATSPPLNCVAGDWFEVQAVISGGAAAAVSVSGASWLYVIG